MRAVAPDVPLELVEIQTVGDQVRDVPLAQLGGDGVFTKAIQQALFDIYLEAGGPSMSSDSVARLGEAQLDRLAEVTWRAIAHVDPALSYADFLDLPFSVGELIQAFPSVAKAAGLPVAFWLLAALVGTVVLSARAVTATSLKGVG